MLRLLPGLLVLLLLSSGCLGATLKTLPEEQLPLSAPSFSVPHVVAATYDTGTNPFHPCFRRPDFQTPADAGDWFPADAKPLNLTFADTYSQSIKDNKEVLESIKKDTLYYVPGTNLLYYGDVDGPGSFVDRYPHGAQASSQIGCAEFGMAPEAFVVVLNWYTNLTAARRDALVRWSGDQAWIDVVHLNIQDTPNPLPASKDVGIEYVIKKGKFVVIAGGNGVQGGGANYPMELSRYNGPAGSLIAGASDNDGYTSFSNLNPHVVMDGMGTRAAAPRNYESTSFGGTSSASPRITGYVTHLLYSLRVHFNYTGGSVGDVLMDLGATKMAKGPLADGKLTVAELHEVVRKTANPNPHASKWDGAKGNSIPQPVATPFAVYTKMGYGKVSEHTVGNAFNVTIGALGLPARQEDAFYERSEQFRKTWWGSA